MSKTQSAEKLEDVFRDPEQAELELKMHRDIGKMPEEVQQRFKALKVLYDQVNDLDDEEEKEYRKIELKYEHLYQAIYKKRAETIAGTIPIDEDLCK